MGSFIEINDTLQITREQGFPAELDIERHLQQPYEAAEFEGREFAFEGKANIRVYHRPPVRVFLAENRDGKWIYCGQIHMLSVNHDYAGETTSGKYKILRLFTPQEMKLAHQMFDTPDGRIASYFD